MGGVLAIDLGATSGRAILTEIREHGLVMTEVNRFENKPVKKRGFTSWNILFLQDKILESIEKAKEYCQVLSIGIDTWGVDYGLLDSEGQMVAYPIHYRDKRTKGVLDRVSEYSSISDLYFKTGNQLMEINTLFQLLVHRRQSPTTYFKASTLLMMPDLLNYYLTGFVGVERSIASTTQMMDARTRRWRQDVLEMFEIDTRLLPHIIPEGQILGELKSEFALGNPKVVSVLSHDTASAIASLPVTDKPSIFISSGTWSLIGTVLDEPLMTEKSLAYDFTNELGEDGKITFLKNCTGLWIIEELRRQFDEMGRPYSFEEISQMVLEEQSEVPIFDTNHPSLAESGQMIEKISHLIGRDYLQMSSSPGILFKSAYHSLAHKYKEVVEQLEELTDEAFADIYLIGGGSKSTYLAQLTADMTGKRVWTGLSEATAIGNSLVQLVAMGEVSDMTEARSLVAQSFPLTSYQPNQKKVSLGHDKLS